MDDHRMTESYLRWRRNALCAELAKLPPEAQQKVMDEAFCLIRIVGNHESTPGAGEEESDERRD